jgi:uncharacterized membrane-anchored protein YhcB (DUF1043 family)
MLSGKMEDALIDRDFVFGLITGVIIGLIIVWLVKRKRNV